MKRIRLSSEEKTVLRMLANGFGCPDIYPLHVFVSAVGSLERKGLAQGAWTEEHDLDDARITRQGKVYLAHNPTLRNPVDWKWAATTVIAALAAVAGVAALFVSCSLLNK